MAKPQEKAAAPAAAAKPGTESKPVGQARMFMFNQAVKIDRQFFQPGLREVPAAIQAHKHFKMFFSAGKIAVPGASASTKELKDLKKLPLPSSEIAKQAAATAKTVAANQEVKPEATVGG